MARTNMRSTRVKPKTDELLTLEVLARKQISAGFARVTLGRGDIEKFVPLGYDQWFRLFLPVPGGSLDRVPAKLDLVSYLKFLTVAKATRPVLRNYSVRSYRADGETGPELDVDVVLHGSPEDGTAGPASTWARTCRSGDHVGLLDEGLGFQLPDDVRRLRLVADETGLPAIANILASLPDDISGEALVELADEDDRQKLTMPPGFAVTWLVRGPGETPGRLALAEGAALPTPDSPWFGWVAGEQALATGLRRQWVSAGLPKDRVMFCGYWRAGH